MFDQHNKIQLFNLNALHVIVDLSVSGNTGDSAVTAIKKAILVGIKVVPWLYKMAT